MTVQRHFMLADLLGLYVRVWFREVDVTDRCLAADDRENWALLRGDPHRRPLLLTDPTSPVGVFMVVAKGKAGTRMGSDALAHFVRSLASFANPWCADLTEPGYGPGSAGPFWPEKKPGAIDGDA